MKNSKINEYRENLAKTFLSVLEEKQLDWKKGWTAEKPQNAETGYKYRGINFMYLKLIARARGYEDNRWASFLQIKKNGWKLQNAKGHGVKVEYWFPYDDEEKKAVTWKELKDVDGRIGEGYSLRATYTTVFNGDLIEGIPEKIKENHKEVDQEQLIEKIAEGMQVPIYNDGQDQAYYIPAKDEIHLPEKDSFFNSYAYNATALHELAHATGHEKRLNREMKGHFGTPEYAYEELVAEMTSCFLSADLQVEQTQEHIDNHKAYVQSWIQMIEDKPENLVKAIAQAEKASQYMDEMAEREKDKAIEKAEERTMEVDESCIESKNPIEKRKEVMKETPVQDFLQALKMKDTNKMSNILKREELEIGNAVFTTNESAVKSQEVQFGDKYNRVVARFYSTYEPLQVLEPEKPIVSNISAIVYQNDVPVAVGNVGGKEAISLKEAKENYEEVKETWERLTDQKGITCLGRNISFDLYIQAHSQMKKLYGDDAETLMGNCGNHIFILTNDDATAKNFSENLGNETIVDIQRSGDKLTMKKYFSESTMEKPLLSMNQLEELQEGECVIKRVMKRRDLKGHRIRPTPIFNSVESGKVFLFRYEYLQNTFPNPDQIDMNKMNPEDCSYIQLENIVFDYRKAFAHFQNGGDSRSAEPKKLSELSNCDEIIRLTKHMFGIDVNTNTFIIDLIKVINDSDAKKEDKQAMISMIEFSMAA